VVGGPGRRALLLLFLCLSVSLAAQEVRIASYNMERLGEDRKDYRALAKVITRFDLVAAEEVMNSGGMRSVLQQLGTSWSDAMSEAGEGSKTYKEFFGFFYDGKIQLERMLGAYPDKHEFFRPPYGAQFRARGSALVFTLVACHIIYGKNERERAGEIRHLGEVYAYFEKLTGGQTTTIIAGDFNEERASDFQCLLDLDDLEVIPDRGSTIGAHGPAHAYDHMFLPAALRSRELSADVDYWTDDYAGSRRLVADHFPVYTVLKTGQ
jgi:deoxyribonuclease-1-like protein